MNCDVDVKSYGEILHRPAGCFAVVTLGQGGVDLLSGPRNPGCLSSIRGCISQKPDGADAGVPLSHSSVPNSSMFRTHPFPLPYTSFQRDGNPPTSTPRISSLRKLSCVGKTPSIQP